MSKPFPGPYPLQRVGLRGGVPLLLFFTDTLSDSQSQHQPGTARHFPLWQPSPTPNASPHPVDKRDLLIT